MSEDYDVFEVEAKPEPKAKAKAEPKDESQPENMTPEEFAALRRDVRRMWSPEPEETR